MELWRQCAKWLIGCRVLPETHRVTWEGAQVCDLAQALRDGVLLCQLLNNLLPLAINLREINLRPQMSQFLCLKNIRTFLGVCQNKFQLKKSELFEAFDLFDVRDFAKVLSTLSVLSHSAIATQRGFQPFPMGVDISNDDIYNGLSDHIDDTVDEADDLYDCVDDAEAEGDEIYEDLMRTVEQPAITKKRFAKEWGEADKATQQVEKIESDPNAIKIDVDKARQHAHARTHTAEECRSDYAAQLQKFNQEQKYFYYSEIPQIFNKLQDLDERRIRRLAEGYSQFSDLEKKVQPIISKCLDGISAAGAKVDEKQDSLLLVEQHKSGFERPGDLDFEDYTQGIKAAGSDSSLNLPKVRGKLWPFSRKHKPPPAEDFSHLPPEQRKKMLQAKIDDVSKKLHMTLETSEALEKMKGVYEQNPDMGNPSILEPQISETAQNIGYLRGELAKYETWLSEAVGGDECVSAINNNHHLTEKPAEPSENQYNIYTEFDDDFEDCGQCTALYTFEGNSEGTISVTDGELLTIMEEDKGDGWMRVVRANGEEGFIPASYVKLVS